nr:PREDICTED: uncharacterized protein LOC107078371 isoform X2 [Lepisosteus oculatus]
MGSGSSRGKKIAPELVREAKAYRAEKKDGNERDPKDDSRLFTSYKVPNISDFSQSGNRLRPHCHSEGNDSDVSADDDEDDIDRELDRVLAECDGRRFYSHRTPPKKSLGRSHTYSFCNARQVHPRNEFSSTPRTQSVEQLKVGKQPPQGPDTGKRGDVTLGFPREKSLFAPDSGAVSSRLNDTLVHRIEGTTHSEPTDAPCF